MLKVTRDRVSIYKLILKLATWILPLKLSLKSISHTTIHKMKYYLWIEALSFPVTARDKIQENNLKF